MLQKSTSKLRLCIDTTFLIQYNIGTAENKHASVKFLPIIARVLCGRTPEFLFYKYASKN
jgi:hypothetical protein